MQKVFLIISSSSALYKVYCWVDPAWMVSVATPPRCLQESSLWGMSTNHRRRHCLRNLLRFHTHPSQRLPTWHQRRSLPLASTPCGAPSEVDLLRGGAVRAPRAGGAAPGAAPLASVAAPAGELSPSAVPRCVAGTAGGATPAGPSFVTSMWPTAAASMRPTRGAPSPPGRERGALPESSPKSSSSSLSSLPAPSGLPRCFALSSQTIWRRACDSCPPSFGGTQRRKVPSSRSTDLMVFAVSRRCAHRGSPR
mmetsp:Transcript_20640/g.57846  ORF Transcript_20640/g.57846 Transcript_20640/m.57846 type:complete len:252 (+) Transcript_20640:497-1252(+)